MGWTRFLRRRSWDEERARELEAYLEIETEENTSRGMPVAEARHAALKKLGNPTLIREEIYRMNSIGFIETLWQDLRYGVRVLRKSPGFALVAVLSLALGIGANTAAFSVIHAVLLRSLPYPDPGRLVRLGQDITQGAVSIPEYEFWKEHASSFASAAGYRGGGDRNLIFGAGQEWIKTMTVTADFFRTLGIAPSLGREFNSEETRPRGPQAIVLSDSLWQRSFGADPEVLGRSITLDDTRYSVIGVLPRGFWFPQAADAFVPLQPTGSLDDKGMNTQMIARLKPGVSLRQAAAEMPAITDSIRRAYPDRLSRQYRGLTVVPYQDWLVGDVRLNLLLLFGAVALLLLIACSNLASLLLARLAARQREIAMRLALGSSRGRLLRQFLIENVLLTMVGGAAGLLAARALLDVLVALIPFNLPASAPMRLDAPVLAFTLAVAFATGLAFSLAPILTSSRLDLQEALKTGGRSGVDAPQRTRSVLVVSEVALSVTLLVAAGQLIQSLYRMHQERLGFNPRGLTTLTTPFAKERRRSAADLWRYETTLLQRFQALPGVSSVAGINVLPLAGFSNLPTQREAHPENSIGGMEVRVITPEYFEVMGIPMRRGRSFHGSDTGSSPPVILVNETLARRWWPNGDPVGDRVVIGRFQGKDFGSPTPREVVGVAGDTKTVYLKEPPRPTVYIPAAQMQDANGAMTWVLRANRSAGLAAELRQAIAEIDPRQRVGRVRSMDEIVDSTTATSRFDAWLFGFLAGLALLLTAIGVYGLLSFSVARRTSEIGTRMALGASRANVLALVLKQGVTLIAIGLVLGLVGALAATRFLATLLFGVRATDPSSFLGVSALLLSVGLLASYLPARRATKVDPMVALRYE
jgi:putative ABC transport system permease protein